MNVPIVSRCRVSRFGSYPVDASLSALSDGSFYAVAYRHDRDTNDRLEFEPNKWEEGYRWVLWILANWL